MKILIWKVKKKNTNKYKIRIKEITYIVISKYALNKQK
jgi:hypothetical protein